MQVWSSRQCSWVGSILRNVYRITLGLLSVAWLGLGKCLVSLAWYWVILWIIDSHKWLPRLNRNMVGKGRWVYPLGNPNYIWFLRSSGSTTVPRKGPCGCAEHSGWEQIRTWGLEWYSVPGTCSSAVPNREITYSTNWKGLERTLSPTCTFRRIYSTIYPANGLLPFFKDLKWWVIHWFRR